jgi:hypothetical protein
MYGSSFGGFGNCGGGHQVNCGAGYDPYAGVYHSQAYGHSYPHAQHAYNQMNGYAAPAQPYPDHAPHGPSYDPYNQTNYASSYHPYQNNGYQRYNASYAQPSYPPLANNYPAYNPSPSHHINSQSYSSHDPHQNGNHNYTSTYSNSNPQNVNNHEYPNTSSSYAAASYPARSNSPIFRPTVTSHQKEFASNYSNNQNNFQFKTISPVRSQLWTSSQPAEHMSTNHAGNSPLAEYSPSDQPSSRQSSSHHAAVSDLVELASSDAYKSTYSNNFEPVVRQVKKHLPNTTCRESPSSDSDFGPNNTTTYTSIAKFTHPNEPPVTRNRPSLFTASEQFYLNYVNMNASYDNNLESAKALLRASANNEDSSLNFFDTVSLFSLKNSSNAPHTPNGLDRSEERSVLKYNPKAVRLSPIRSIEDSEDHSTLTVPSDVSSLILQSNQERQYRQPQNVGFNLLLSSHKTQSVEAAPVTKSPVEAGSVPDKQIEEPPVSVPDTAVAPVKPVQEPMSILRSANANNAGDVCDDNHPGNKPPSRQVKFAPIDESFH